MTKRTGHIHEATVRLEASTDSAAVGAAVTVELCGGVDHDGPCRWPHNNEISDDGERFMTLFVAVEAEVDEVHGRIALALRSSSEWSVVSDGPSELVRDARAALAERLAASAA